MKILAIETSCDETAIAILETSGSKTKPVFSLLSNVVLSQIKIHKPFGGVVPNLAMREHQKNLVPILTTALRETKMLQGKKIKIAINSKRRSPAENLDIKNILAREPVLLKALEGFLKKYEAPEIDVIAVTYGPGLEPALWVGINFARALAAIWKKPLIPVNHLEGHIYASWLRRTDKKIIAPRFPLLALIVSGGHTELVLMKKHLAYKVLGETRDDAAGEAFDKVAKMLGLGYPGGPEISKLAESGDPYAIDFPRPMMNSNDLDFSFSGLKTAVLYFIKDRNFLDEKFLSKADISASLDISASFEQAAVDVLVSKTAKALKKYKVKSLVVGGGVAANKKLRSSLEILIKKLHPEIELYLSPLWLTGDNAAMIAAVAYFKALDKKYAKPATLKAQGNLRLK